ncbi:MAG TPA: alpha/beta fold hydrolase [Mycobacteriales bacterium]|nr:alpha/beta fold hydrolase [Mycobacteriales bacterium]
MQTWLMIISRLALAVALSAGLVAPTAFADPPPPQTEAKLLTRARERPADQAANPEHAQRHALVAPGLAQLLHPDREEDPRREAEVDPFLAGWAPARGAELDVSITNRYGARLHAHLSMPKTRAGRLPAIILLTGGAGSEHTYREMAHGLAEAGYLVLGLNVQGDNGSQEKPADPNPKTPQNEYCEPGAWQKPQEAGVRETGECAGVPTEPDITAEELRSLALRDDFQPSVAYYDAVKARKFFGALDGVRWLLSADNPWRNRVDGKRIGIAGHSLGAHGALLAANADPARRFRAAVTFDGFGRLAPTGLPSVPTLFQHQDLSDLPHLVNTDQLPGNQDAAEFAAARVPTGVVHLAGSTHQEWSYVPPGFSAGFAASRDGKRVALHYAVAWFDLWLKPGTQADARRRLTAPTFSGSTDGSSRGEGPWDPATQRTVSPRIGGETTREHLSPLFRSWIAAPGARCADLRAGC